MHLASDHSTTHISDDVICDDEDEVHSSHINHYIDSSYVCSTLTIQ